MTDPSQVSQASLEPTVAPLPEAPPVYTAAAASSQQTTIAPPPPPPPRRVSQTVPGEKDADGVLFTRDPHKLVAYLVAFPRPAFKDAKAAEQVPPRFLIYTPPPPPIPAPAEGETETKIQKIQRKWQDEVREAKTSDAKVASWKGVKSRVTKGIDWAMGQTKSSSLEFLNRMPADKQKASTEPDSHADDGVQEGDTTKKTVGLEELVLVYPASIPGTQEEIRAEFISSMLRSKSKAQKDAIIATGLIPVTFAIDILATIVWPFGGLVEIDTVWAVASMRGAKTARSITKRLNSSGSGPEKSSGGIGSKVGAIMSKVAPGDKEKAQDDHQLKLTFVPSTQTEVLNKYLASECHTRDRKLFGSPGVVPTETDVVNAIGWHPSQTGGETKNWEDEQWELEQVKDDFKQVFHKGAREWDKWCSAYEKNPQKALKK